MVLCFVVTMTKKTGIVSNIINLESNERNIKQLIT